MVCTHVAPGHPLVAGVHVGADVAERMADMQADAGRVREHVEHVQLRVVGDPLETVARSPTGFGAWNVPSALPAVLPGRLDLVGELRRV